MIKILLILALLTGGWVGISESSSKKDKDAKPTTQEAKKHDDMLTAKGINIPCLKADKNKSNKQNAESIKVCIDSLPNK